MANRPRGHVRKLTNDRWRLYAEAAPDPVTGKRRQATKHVVAPNRRTALDLLAEHVADVAAGRWDRGTSERTVDQVLDAFLAQTSAEPNTVHEWKGALHRYIRPRIGELPAADLDAQTLEQLYRELQRGGGREGRPLSAATVRKVHTPLRLALSQAVRWKWIATNPAADIAPSAGKARSIDPPEVADVERLVALADELDPEWSVALRVLAHTGCRRGELCGLKWSDIDLVAGELGIRRVVVLVGSDVVVREYGKTDSSTRRLGVGPRVVERLAALRATQRERALAAGVRVSDGFVFSTDIALRTPWHPDVVTHRFARLRKRAGLHHVRLHDLRHFMATRWLANGKDVVTVAGRGGWANANELLSTYAHWMPARDRQGAAELDDVG